MSWFTSTDTYAVEVWSIAAPERNGDGTEKPGEGETATVTMRPLNAGDQADIQDILRMEYSDDEGDDNRSQLAIGSMRRMSVEKACVDWNIPGPKPTPEAIRQLAPVVFEQIYAHVRLGNVHPTLPPAPEKKPPSEPTDEKPSSARKPTPSSEAAQ